MTQTQHTGACLCGAVRYRVRGPLRPVINCHCGQCQRWSGHIVAATQAAREQIEIEEAGALRWFESTPGIRRGFCGQCGSSLFWDDSATTGVSIMAGTLDPPTGLETRCDIFVADKSDYYPMPLGRPLHDADETPADSA